MDPSETSDASRDSLRVSSREPPGWQPASGRVPEVGDVVYCTSGPATVVKVLGRTSDGSRLLELRCADQPQPFFASSSNVLLQDMSDQPSPFLDESSELIG